MSGTEGLQIGCTFCITICVCVCVDCCITLGSGAPLVCKCCVYCVENIPSEMKFFVYVIIFIVYIFNLFHVVTFVYN